MIKIEGHGVPTKFKPAERGTVYTDLDTGKRYKCLGKKGFVNQDAVNEPVEYHWQLVDMVDESEMPEGSGGGGVSSWNDLTDKPFGEVTQEVFFEINNFSSSDNPTVDFKQAIVVGEQYTVIVNGQEYSCVALDVYGEVVSLGNDYISNNLGGEDTGEPFALTYWVGTTQGYLQVISEEETYDIKILGNSYSCLDVKYLPKFSENGPAGVISYMDLYQFFAPIGVTLPTIGEHIRGEFYMAMQQHYMKRIYFDYDGKSYVVLNYRSGNNRILILAMEDLDHNIPNINRNLVSFNLNTYFDENGTYVTGYTVEGINEVTPS